MAIQIKLAGRAAEPRLPALLQGTARSGTQAQDPFLPSGYLQATGTFDVSATAWQRLKDAMGYALIVTPICVATLVAIGNRFSPGKRWVLLRSAAESIKREIYRYRVRPLSGGNDGSREKALQQAVDL